jgi:hypothetical protein
MRLWKSFAGLIALCFVCLQLSNCGDLSPTILGSLPATGTVGSPYSGTLAPSDNNQNRYSWTSIAGLPPGVTASQKSGVLTVSGTPTQPGSFNFSAFAGDSQFEILEYAITIEIATAEPRIITAPAAVSAPVGQIATFAVTASSATPLRFQWSKNGFPVSGAIASSYTTPPAVAADDGASFTVEVSNKAGSASSTAAVLTVLPRWPLPGDWRFQGMDLPAGTVEASVENSAELRSYQSENRPGFLAAPLEVGLQFADTCKSSNPADCVWRFSGYNPPKDGVFPTSVYKSGSLDKLDTGLGDLGSSTVVTSLDLVPENQIYALGALQTSQAAGFEISSQTVPSDQLQTMATKLGEQSRVITGVSYDADGNVFVVSYGWTDDPNTVYEVRAVMIPSHSTSVATADSDDIIAAITQLAGQGFIITALGGNPARGVLIVGSRVKGDALPRALEVFQQTDHQGHLSNAMQALWRKIGGTTPSSFVQIGEQ